MCGCLKHRRGMMRLWLLLSDWICATFSDLIRALLSSRSGSGCWHDIPVYLCLRPFCFWLLIGPVICLIYSCSLRVCLFLRPIFLWIQIGRVIFLLHLCSLLVCLFLRPFSFWLLIGLGLRVSQPCAIPTSAWFFAVLMCLVFVCCVCVCLVVCAVIMYALFCVPCLCVCFYGICAVGTFFHK